MIEALYGVVCSRISDVGNGPRKAVGAAVIRDADWSVGVVRDFQS